MLTGILLANGTLNASILNSLYNENLVKEGKCCPTLTLGKDGDRQIHDKLSRNCGDSTPLQLTSFIW